MGDDPKILEHFLARMSDEDAKLARALGKLADGVGPALGDLLTRFHSSGGGELDQEERGLARRVLAKLHRPSVRGIELLGAVLAYLAVDRGAGGALSRQELLLAVEILELFCKADSINDTLSQKELEMLLAVLEHLDRDGNGRLDPDERTRLRDELWDADAFLEQQKASNPRLRRLLARH